MPEIKTEVKTFRIQMQCEKCDGEMTPTGIVFDSFPPQYGHSCNECGFSKNIQHRYPRVVHEDVSNG